jgi:hypothetical protein
VESRGAGAAQGPACGHPPAGQRGGAPLVGRTLAARSENGQAAKTFGARDVESVIAKQHRKKLDWRYIHAQLTPLAELKEDPQILPKLKELRRIVESDEAG